MTCAPEFGFLGPAALTFFVQAKGPVLLLSLNISRVYVSRLAGRVGQFLRISVGGDA